MNTRRPDAVAAVEPSVTRERPRGWLLLLTRILDARLLPSNRMPQDDLLYTAALLAHNGAWLVYLQRSPQVRGLFRS